MKQRYLVLYDYGQGGLWGYVLAETAEDITRRFPELVVVNEVPDWMGGDLEVRLRETEEDIDSPRGGLLANLLSNRSDA